MEKLNNLSLTDVVREVASSGKPLLGICLGMQLLFDESLEFGCHKGLGLIPGRVCPLGDDVSGLKIPYMGWNRLEILTDDFLFSQIPSKDRAFVYFVHSFYANDCESHTLPWRNRRKVTGVLKGTTFTCHSPESRAGGTCHVKGILRNGGRKMKIIPAIDIISKKAVRLEKGDFGKITEYSADPVCVALSFYEAGATELHVVDLDGAKSGSVENIDVIKRIIKESGLNVEVGGGIRDEDKIKAYLDAGAKRVIIGTAAAEIGFCVDMALNRQLLMVGVERQKTVLWPPGLACRHRI